MKRTILAALAVLALTGLLANAQSFGPTGTTTLTLTVGAEASIRVDTSSTALTTAGAVFNNYTGTTSFTYKVRTTKTTGSGTITLQVTADFSPVGGPSVATPPTAGDVLDYTCTLTAPGTGCSGSVAASTTAATSVATFGAGARSAAAGNTGSVGWTLTNDPQYQTGSYTATVTYTISAA
jgi:hypothetical protein